MNKIVWLSASMTVLLVIASGMTGAAPDDTDTSTKETGPSIPPQCCLNQNQSVKQTESSGVPHGCCEVAKGGAPCVADPDAKELESGCVLCNDNGCKEQCKDCAEANVKAGVNAENSNSSDIQKLTLAMADAVRMGRGLGLGKGAAMEHAGDSQHDIDHQDFFFLIEHKDSIRRTIKNLPNGIETLTESDDADVAARIQKHVASMYERMDQVNPIRMRDPLFREIFANAKQIKMEVEPTEHGVLVTETSDDAYVVKLLQEHAKVVSLFIKNGYSELPKNHTPPEH